MRITRWRFWAWPSELRSRGVLGINRRNACYLLPGNRRDRFPLADDKLATKQICETHGIPVPRTYAVIDRQGDVRRFVHLLGDRCPFVIKPARGCEGRGILVIARRRDNVFFTAGGRALSLTELQYHLSAILAGLYTLSGQPDRAIVEERILPHPAFHHIALGGTPDVRVLLFRNKPAMAMIRLPTRASAGRANLHQGAVGAGIDMASGTTFGGVCNSQMIDVHPDTGFPLAGHRIPCWDRLLSAATQLSKQLGLDYVGVDFVIDASAQPVVLEANARPGLAIQVANRMGLLNRLEAIENHPEPTDEKTRQDATCLSP